MKNIPIVFPISLAVIIVLTFFTGAWAISENALGSTQPVYAAADTPPASAAEPGEDWYERAAIWVCPLH